MMIERLTIALADRYRIEREIGAGGMATVYLADDLRHQRKVALKVMRPELAAVIGADRFLAEIKTTANLQHPHILALFDSGTIDGTVFYVMPYVEGESLRERLSREKQLPIDVALRIATEVANALQYAHQHGVIHRDIKPENILLHGGHALVADFGIALAAATGGSRMTETGMSLGTPTYMSPEQAMGERTLDARTDIYALGCVLYEMLVGDPPYTGSTAQAIVAKIITEKPPSIVARRDRVPTHVEDAVLTALEKLPADRFSSAAEFEAALQGDRFPLRSTVRVAAAARPTTNSRNVLVAGAVLALAGIAVAAVSLARDDAGAALPVVHLTLDVGLDTPDLGRFAVSSDGSMFAFSAAQGIAVRDPGSRDFRILPGSQTGESPSFSPDGEWIAFHAGGRLRKIAVNGGSALALIADDSVRGSSVHWGADGTIAFESSQSIYVIPAEGGTPRRLPGAHGTSPRLLPDGRGILYVDPRTRSTLMYFDLAADTAVAVLEESSEGQYVASGHIVYAHSTGGLFAVRFDPRNRAVEGAPVPLVSDFRPNGVVGAFAITSNGMLVYRAGIDAQSKVLLSRGTTVAKSTRTQFDTLPLEPSVLSYARFSPDGRSIALTIGSARGTNRHTAIYDTQLGTLTRFTLEGGGHSPVWSPDGRNLVFTAEGDDSDAEDLFVQPIDRSTQPRRILRVPDDQHASAWPANNTVVVSNASGGFGARTSGGNVYVINPQISDGAVRTYLSAQWDEFDAVVSPDGRFAAYVSNESGSREVYVRSFPDAAAGGQTKISSSGGFRPRWAQDGRAVLYLGLDDRTIHSVRVSPGPPFTVDAREPVTIMAGAVSAWDVDPRSGRIVVAQAVTEQVARIVVIVNWPELLRRNDTPQ